MNFKISVLVFIKNQSGALLMLRRRKAPNKGLWSPIGGKLEMEIGESPHECAAREAFEETGMKLEANDLHLFCMISERAYEGTGHWLMFLFDCRRPIETLPAGISEGEFAFFTREEIDSIPTPETDREGLWSIYDQRRDGFVAARADCSPQKPLEIIVEQIIE